MRAVRCSFLLCVPLHMGGAVPEKPCMGDFIWLVQGRAAPPPWFFEVATNINSFAIFSSWDTACDGHILLPKMRWYCTPSVRWSKQRNALYRLALAWEEERGCLFQYSIFSDDNGAFYPVASGPSRHGGVSDQRAGVHLRAGAPGALPPLHVQARRKTSRVSLVGPRDVSAIRGGL